MQLSQASSALMTEDEKFIRGVLPSVTTMLKRMTEAGACLKEDKGMDISAEQFSAADEARIEGVASLPSAGTASQAAPVRGYYIKRVMDRVVAPEVEDKCKELPHCWGVWKRDGIDIVLAADGTARPVFGGRLLELELGVTKIVIPDVPGPQQNSCLACPIFMHDGQSYASLQATIGQIIRDKYLADSVTEQNSAGTKHKRWVRWRLCSDAKLIQLLAGLGGSRCNRACFICLWDSRCPLHKAVL
jgi:hypothetical protein